MNRRGFTLTELIVTIALLAIITTISFVSITSAIKQSKLNDCRSLFNNIKAATNEYVSDNRYNSEFVDNIDDYQTELDGSILVNNHYLKGEIIDPFSKETVRPEDIGITVYFNEDYTMRFAMIKEPSSLLEVCKIQEVVPDNSQQQGTKTNTIILNNNGATTGGTASVTATYNSSVITPETITLPTREYTITYNANGTGLTMPSNATSRYSLNGWYTGAESGSKVINKNQTLTYNTADVSGYIKNLKWVGNENKTLYAHWSAIPTTLGTIYKIGNVCKWNTKTDGSGTSYASGMTNYAATKNTTLYAYCENNVNFVATKNTNKIVAKFTPVKEAFDSNLEYYYLIQSGSSCPGASTGSYVKGDGSSHTFEVNSSGTYYACGYLKDKDGHFSTTYKSSPITFTAVGATIKNIAVYDDNDNNEGFIPNSPKYYIYGYTYYTAEVTNSGNGGHVGYNGVYTYVPIIKVDIGSSNVANALEVSITGHSSCTTTNDIFYADVFDEITYDNCYGCDNFLQSSKEIAAYVWAKGNSSATYTRHEGKTPPTYSISAKTSFKFDSSNKAHFTVPVSSNKSTFYLALWGNSPGCPKNSGAQHFFLKDVTIGYWK